MPIASKKLSLLTLVFFLLFIGLGCWQLSRAEEKKTLLREFAIRKQQPPVTFKAPRFKEGLEEDLRFYQARLSGTFDNAHTILLDNKIFQHQVGYEVYTPFKLNNANFTILVDRGFVPLFGSRNNLPSVSPILGQVTINGLLNLPPHYLEWGPMLANKDVNWPLRVEFIKVARLGKYLSYQLSPYVLTLMKNDPLGFAIEWQIITILPEKHIAYAIQWFAMAATLLILFVVLNFHHLKQ